MSHRAQQIVDALVANLAANTSIQWAVLRARIDGLDVNEIELPAALVNFSEDAPLADLGVINIAFVDSLLHVQVILVAEDGKESDLTDKLFEMRRQVHISLMADRSQGLAFVIDTRYAGADAPSFHNDADRYSAALATNWHMHYRMNITDPS